MYIAICSRILRWARYAHDLEGERPLHSCAQVTDDITDLTCADLFSEVGKQTPIAARFSTVTHERGSPESLRDIRGFSVSPARAYRVY